MKNLSGDINSPILEVQDLDRNFGGLKALSYVSFSLEQGVISALIGPNGAGKTTLLNLVSGIETPDRGEIKFLGVEISGCDPWEITAKGICRTFQTGRIFQRMTVLENLLVGSHLKGNSGWFSGMFHFCRERSEEKDLLERACELLEYFSLGDFTGELAGNIPLVFQKRLEIARALASEPKLLLLDEPVAGLNIRETEEMGEMIRGLGKTGVTILLVEHDMNLVMNLADWIFVLHHGQKIASGPPVEVRNNPDVVAAYLGNEPR